MLVFELTMPNRGSWNGHWSGEKERHIIVKNERYIEEKGNIPKILDIGDFYYRWDDGWTACVSVTKMSAPEARKLKKKSSGFCGYDWMVDSILSNCSIQHR